MDGNKHSYDKRAATLWAQEVLADPAAIILDTETTGLGDADQVSEVAAINTAGETLLDTLVCPSIPIPAEATAIHGIDAAMVAAAPTFVEIYPDLRRLLDGASRIVVYNAAYDRRLLNQSRLVGEHPIFREPPPWECAMERYAAWYGEWNEYYGNYRWQRLDGGHRALGDCLATLARIKEMAIGG